MSVDSNSLIFERAIDEIGVKEWKDGSNPVIERYHAYATVNNWFGLKDDIPWCSSFMCYVVEKAGFKSTNSKAARSWLKWGHSREYARTGDIVVLKRGLPWQGHVALFIEEIYGELILLGGNQKDSVCIMSYSKNDCIGIRSLSSECGEYNSRLAREAYKRNNDEYGLPLNLNIGGKYGKA